MEYLCCTSCRVAQGQLGVELKKCAKCHSQRYCSRECQQADWSKHKLHCEERPADESEPSLRSNLRFRMGSSLSGEPDEAESVYYLRTSQPHVHDVTVSGPYHPIAMIRPQLMRRLSGLSFSAFSSFFETFPENIEGEGPIGLSSWVQISGPLDDNPRHSVTVELICEHNPAMTRHLPKPVWRIMAMHREKLSPSEQRRFLQTYGYMPVQEVEICTSVATKDEAEAETRSYLEENVRRYPASRGQVMGWKGNDFMCAVVSGQKGSPGIEVIVQASYDDGRTDHDPQGHGFSPR